MSVIKRNLSAQFYSQVVTLAIQIGLVPILIGAWGIERYGVWITVTAVPQFLMLSDFGFTSTAKNDMSMRVANSDRIGAQQTFQTVFLLLLCLSAVVFIFTLTFIGLVPLSKILNTGAEQEIDIAITVLSQVVSVMAFQFIVLFCAGLRSERRAATETLIVANARLSDGIITALAVLYGANLAEAALCALAVRIFYMISAATYCILTTWWVKIGFQNASRDRFVALVTPSLTYMLVHLGNACLLLGPVLVLGMYATPEAVALYAITRVVTRLGMSGANMLAFSMSPEYSFSFGSRNRSRFRSILIKHAALSVLGIFPYVAIMLFLGDFGIDILSHRQVEANSVLTLTLALSVVAEIVWTFFFCPIAAINRHQLLALVYTGICAVAIVAGYILHDVFSLALISLVCNALMIAVSASFFTILLAWLKTPNDQNGKK